MRDSDSGATAESIDDLPEACIMNAISFATPREACRFSTLSSSFKSAAESDALWEKFLPDDYKTTIASSSDPALFTRCSSRKELYLHLSDNPLLVDGGRKSLSLEKCSGKIRYMLSARDLSIVWGDSPEYWAWAWMPNTTFKEVAELITVCWLEIQGRIKTSLLSRKTFYSANFVFQLTSDAYGFDYFPVEVSVGHVGGELAKRKVQLDTLARRVRRSPFMLRRRGWRGDGVVEARTVAGDVSDEECESGCGPVKKRADGWLEVEMGEFYSGDECDDEEVEIFFSEVERGGWKGGLVVHGIEIRPK